METACDEWISMYSESAGRLWMGERPEVRKAAMLIHVLGLELLKVKTHAEAELAAYRKIYNQIDSSKPTLSAPATNNSVKTHTKVNTTFKQLTPLICINKEDDLINSYVSPDIFNCESPDYSSGNLNKNVLEDEDFVQSPKQLSPKIIRKSRKYFRSRNSGEKLSSQSQMAKRALNNSYSNCTPRKCHDVIDSTPEHDTKKSKLSTKSLMIKSRNRSKIFEKSRPKIGNTLTQMYEQLEKSNRSSHVINCNASQSNVDRDEVCDSDGETVIVNYDSDKPDDVHVNSMLDDDDDAFKNFAINYDQVPEKAAAETKQPTKYSCRTCNRLGHLCSKHDLDNRTMQKTYTGFWDIDFTVKDPMEDSEQSTIFL